MSRRGGAWGGTNSRGGKHATRFECDCGGEHAGIDWPMVRYDHAIRRALGWEVNPGTLAKLEPRFQGYWRLSFNQATGRTRPKSEVLIGDAADAAAYELAEFIAYENSGREWRLFHNDAIGLPPAATHVPALPDQAFDIDPTEALAAIYAEVCK